MSLRHATDTQRAVRSLPLGQVMKMEQGSRVARLHLLILAAVGGQPSQSHRPPSGGEATHSAVVFPEEALCVGPVCG